MAKKARKPLKTRTKSVKKVANPLKSTFSDRLPKNRGEYLELLIRLTEKGNNPKYPNETLTFQAERLKKELLDWKIAKKG